jgi:hypothetical protein
MLSVPLMGCKQKNNTFNAYLLKQVSSCPLKLQYFRELPPNRNKGTPYKSEIKIMMRRVLSLIYPGGKTADDDHIKAIEQTEKWLDNRSSTVYGGVTAYENFHARLPVIVRKNETLTLFQIHGKVLKRRNKSLEDYITGNRKLKEYIREAAYKKWILSRNYPELKLEIRLCFPNPGFQSSVHNLYDKIAYGEADESDVDSLFTVVETDSAINKIVIQSPDPDLHPFFQKQSFFDQITWMGNELVKPSNSAPFIVTGACKTCSYRQSGGDTLEKGCWEEHVNADLLNPGRHVYDLIGHGNDNETEQGNYYQENVPLPIGVESFEDVAGRGGNTITILQRRVLQILASKNKNLPRVWMKRSLKKIIRNISYPLHFIDFEAATSPIPFHKQGKPYQPVFFQFSCHTLLKGGRLQHHHWLDCNERGHPHQKFVKKLISVPEIEKGTLLQYSPFEKQSLKTLQREFSNQGSGDDRLYGKLQLILNGDSDSKSDRFLDMNRLVRDFYYNSYMVNGLGLKQVLYSTIQSSRYLKDRYRKPIEVEGMKMDIIKENDRGLSDPYSLIQKNGESIADGSSAMHGWLHTKTPFCNSKKRTEIQQSLIRYCALDSLALVMIFQEWMQLIKNHEGNSDIVLHD